MHKLARRFGPTGSVGHGQGTAVFLSNMDESFSIASPRIVDIVTDFLPISSHQIYHASFFKACKKQRAVKEAFRFTKLILNPTLSTFNMLMSVCASSQDIEGDIFI